MKSVIILALIFVTLQAGPLNYEPDMCNPGRYYYFNSVHDKGCKDCPKGTFANGTVALTQCEPCRPGLVADEYGSKWCHLCGVGYYETDRKDCWKCPNSWTSRAGSSGVDSCGICGKGAIGKSVYQQGYGYSTVCTDCPAGTFEVGRENCTSCYPGTISDVGSSECVACPAGSIAVNNVCLPCPTGSQDVNRTRCELCPTGTFADNGKCTACPAGWIASFPGSLECTRCQAGTYEYKKTSCFQCAAGTFGTDGISCHQCPSMTISAAGSASCTQCSTGSTAVKANTRCQDESGNEVGASHPQQTTVVSGSGNNSSSNDPILYVLAFGVICALLFVGLSIKNRKLESELQRDRLLYQQS